MSRRLLALHAAALFLIGCAGRGSDILNAREILTAQLPALTAYKAQTEWQTPLVVDAEAPLSDGKTLFLTHGDSLSELICAFDEKAGTPKWTAAAVGLDVKSIDNTSVETRKASVADLASPAILSTQPSLVATTGHFLYIFDADTGKQTSRLAFSKYAAAAMAPSDRIALATVSADAVHVDLLDAKTGAKRWEATAPSKRWPPKIAIDAGLVVVVTNVLTAFDLESGRRAWHADVGGPGSSMGTPRREGEIWLLEVTADGGDRSLIGIDDKGQRRFSLALGRTPVSASAATSRAAPASKGKGATGPASTPLLVLDDGSRVRAVSLADGSAVWTAPSRVEPHVGRSRVVEGRVFFTTETEAVTLDAASGKELARVKLPSGFVPQRLPERLVARPGKAIWVGEAAIAAVDAKTGGALYQINVRGRSSGSFARAAETLAGVQLARGATADAVKKLLITPALVEWQPDDRRVRGNLTVERGLASVGIEAGIYDMLAIGVATQNRIGSARKTAELGRWLAAAGARVRNALNIHLSSVQQEHFLVTPVEWLSGTGVVVFDLDDGSWAEVVTGPDQAFTDHELPHFRPARLSDDGSHVLTTGLGLDATKWVPDGITSPTYVGIRPSAMSLRLPAKRPLNLYESASVVKPGEEITLAVSRF